MPDIGFRSGLFRLFRKVAPSRLPLTIGRQPKIIPCSVLHPDTSNCFTHNGNAMRSVFKKTFPLYMSLTFVPFVVLNLQKVRASFPPLFIVSPALRGKHALFSRLELASQQVVKWGRFFLIAGVFPKQGRQEGAKEKREGECADL